MAKERDQQRNIKWPSMNSSSSSSATSTTTRVFLSLAVVGSASLAWWWQSYKKKKSNRHAPGSKASLIEAHILSTQKPAALLGIRVGAYYNDDNNNTATSLTLTAPLSQNHNVHGTAFAGSLYSVAVLSSYYLLRQWLIVEQQQGSNNNYTLVAKSANIQYKRPVSCEYIVAKSTLLPSRLEEFLEELLRSGKATVFVDGVVLLPPFNDDDDKKKIACTYSAELCAYLPKS